MHQVVRGLFVTGTDTGVGKTVVCAALMHRYRRSAPLRYWKPIQTGVEHDDDTRDVSALGCCQPAEVLASGIRLPQPVSPHLAARLSGVSIDAESLIQETDLQQAGSRWIIEGAGGVLVPLNDRQMMCDLMALLNLPVVVVARSGLGTINHTLLTLEALRRRLIQVVGVVMVGTPNVDNRAAIERHGRVAVIGEMPHFAELNPSTLADWSATSLDRAGRLSELLR